ncbi:MAG: hypothetical protein H0X03_08765 [Nitrosopumilus sp.]|nr:hypothetical protein [Nitrosopumilus sp.]
MCNHQKNINKSGNKKIENINEKIKKQKLNIIKEQRKKPKKNPEKIKKMKENLKKLKSKKSLMVELKNISLGTSKVNYIDPRITVSFLKKHNIPVEKIFQKTLQEKFRWAFDMDENFVF